MTRWIEDDLERMREVDTNTASHCTHGVELGDACKDCFDDADYAGDNDDELAVALRARRDGNVKPLAEYKAKMKGQRRHAKSR